MFILCLKVLGKLRPDEHGEKLRDMSVDEVKLGRLSGPIDRNTLDLNNVAIASRFAVLQGMVFCILLKSADSIVCLSACRKETKWRNEGQSCRSHDGILGQ